MRLLVFVVVFEASALGGGRSLVVRALRQAERSRVQSSVAAKRLCLPGLYSGADSRIGARFRVGPAKEPRARGVDSARPSAFPRTVYQLTH